MIILKLFFVIWVGSAILSGLIHPESRAVSAAIAALLLAAVSGMYL